MISMSSVREDRKDVTIRGVDSSLYLRIVEIAKGAGKTVGDIVNEAFKLFIDVKEGIEGSVEAVQSKITEAVTPVSVISDLEELEVSGDELRELGRKVIFRNIGKLTLKVNRGEFEKYVAAIRDCQVVRVPKELPKLLLLSKARGVRRVEVLENM